MPCTTQICGCVVGGGGEGVVQIAQPNKPKAFPKQCRNQGGGVSRKSDIMLKNPLEPNLKKGGGWGVLRGFFGARGYCPREGHPAPPPNEIHSVGHL